MRLVVIAIVVLVAADARELGSMAVAVEAARQSPASRHNAALDARRFKVVVSLVVHASNLPGSELTAPKTAAKAMHLVAEPFATAVRIAALAPDHAGAA